ncbi:hypothetical protein P43SY_002800 [Pythium insidiosum]|uniref:Uncharacterized protein n=1 Tax=Pythium insidiosum TaxID=114742 RepID=A0AAD5QDG9_PYTIN|nr:hypothetical protein P43SY_002800 [Pythium insidiosum]
MAIDRKLRLLLEQARLPATNPAPEHGDAPSGVVQRVPSREILARLERLRDQDAVASVSLPGDLHLSELLTLTGEVAVEQRDFEVAAECVTWFFSEVAATNQYDFLVYNASVTFWQIARPLMKQSTFQFLVPSLSSIIDALRTTGERDVLWLWRLQLALVHAQLDAKQFPQAAKTINDLVDTQLTPLIAGAVAPESVDSRQLKAVYEEALRLQVHVGSMKDAECQKIIPNVKKALQPSNRRASLLLKLQVIKSGALTGTLDAALIELFQDATSLGPSFVVDKTTDDELTAHVHSATDPQAIDAEIILETGIIAAFGAMEPRLASCCDIVLQAKGKSMDPRLRVLHQVLKAVIVALSPPILSASRKLRLEDRKALLLTRRTEGIRALERAFVACKRQQDANMLESVCLYAWNLALPLLQPSTRPHLTRLFSMAASSLEECQSLALGLRVRLLLEVAKLEASADFVAKAQASSAQALSLDYGTLSLTTTTVPTLDELCLQESKWIRRHFDVHLLPLKKRLDTKLSSDDPVSPDQQLAAGVEQLRDSKDSTQRRRQLGRNLETLNAVLATLASRVQENPNWFSSTEALEVLLHVNTLSGVAWKQLKDAGATRSLVSTALETFFPPADAGSARQHVEGSVFHDRSVQLVEIDLRFRLVEVLAAEMQGVVQQHHTAVAAQRDAKTKTAPASTVNRKPVRAKRDDELDTIAMLSFSRDAFVFGTKIPPFDAPTRSDLTEEEHAQVHERCVELERRLSQLKRDVLQQLTTALRVATRIEWPFVIENTAVYIWNYHFHIFRRIIGSPTAVASSVLPETIAALEAAVAALEPVATSQPMGEAAELLATMALGLALLNEKLGRLDKVNTTVEAFLKRKLGTPTSSSVGLPSVASVPSLYLKRFAELKARVQMQQNAKELVPVESTPQLKTISFLEAMEWTLLQTTAPAFSSLPPPQQAQLSEKAQVFFQKALTVWQSSATEALATFRVDGLPLEEQQQQLELYVEIWVRLGCGAFRFRNTKAAIHCSDQALVPNSNLLDAAEQAVWITASTWRWLALAELLRGRAILTLVSGETAAWSLIKAVIRHLGHAAEYATRVGATSITLRAGEVAWNTVLTVMAALDEERASGERSDSAEEEEEWRRLVPGLRQLLHQLDRARRHGGSTDEWAGRFVGDFTLLVLDVCEKAKDWTGAVEIADAVLSHADDSESSRIPGDLLKDISSFQAIASATPSMERRWAFARHALEQVFIAWQCILDLVNEQDLQQRYEQEQADSAGASTLGYDEWKQGKPTKFATGCPRAAGGWAAFFQQLETSTTQRFYMPWASSLMVVGMQTPSVRHFSHPVLTMHILEQLVDVLTSLGQEELVLPALCLHQVVYFAYAPTKSQTIEIWIDLTLHRVLEHLNISVCSIPLQKALESLQSRAQLILKELQQQQIPLEDETIDEGTGGARKDLLRRRAVLQLSGANTANKAAECVQLLLSVGFVRQGKIVLMMLESIATRSSDSVASQQAPHPLRAVCGLLRSCVLELEGQRNEALESLEHALITGRLDVSTLVAQTIRQCELLEDPKEAQDRLLTTERRVAAALLASIETPLLQPPSHATVKYLTALHNPLTGSSSASTPTTTSSVTSAPTSQSSAAPQAPPPVDLDGTVALASLKFARAHVQVKRANDAVSGGSSLDHALAIFREAMEMLVLVDAKYLRAVNCAKFASAILQLDYAPGALARERALLVAHALFSQAASILDEVRSRGLTLTDSVETDSRLLVPLDREIAGVKLHLAQLELALEQSQPVIKALEMTWYAWDRDSRRTVVDKWLDHTGPQQRVMRHGSASRAFVWASVAENLLHSLPDSLSDKAMATALQAQCRRVHWYHDETEREQTTALLSDLWTRHTSDTAKHETWIACASTAPVPSDSESPSDSLLTAQLDALTRDVETQAARAMENRHVSVVRVCAYELVQLYGCRRPVDCAKSLLLYQSAVVSGSHMQTLVQRCLPSSHAASLHWQRMEKLSATSADAAQHSVPFQLSRLFLEQQSDLYKRMAVVTPVDAVLAALPANVRVLCLQFSPDGCFLYVCLMNSEGFAVMARMESTDTKLTLLAELKQRVETWRRDVSNATASTETSATSDAAEFESVEDSNTVSDALENEFSSIVRGMNEFFSPLWDHSVLSSALQAELPGNHLVLLVDRALEFLPLGALAPLGSADAISRDFSLHMLHHRLAAVKAQPLRRDDIRVAIDPRHDDAGLGDQTLTTIGAQMFKKPGAPLAAWRDLVEHGQPPTPTDWQLAVMGRRAGGVCYVGPSRVIGSMLPLPTLAAMNLSASCYVLLLLDRAENAGTARRQSKIDSDKPRWQLELENDPYVCALLCSLCGVNALVMNQWTSTFHSARRLANAVLGGISRGQSIARAVRRYPDSVAPITPGAAASSVPRKASAAAVEAVKPRLKNSIRFNTVVFGLGHVTLKGSD